ncbi:hypothetical protein ADH76_14215 [Enterocloster clostridioformis]|nr:hypothetical protein ADH76_14215 [Enterocloster clostridioformis]
MADRNVDPIKMNYYCRCIWLDYCEEGTGSQSSTDEELVRMNDYCLLSDFVVTENYIMTCIGINAQCDAK